MKSEKLTGKRFKKLTVLQKGDVEQVNRSNGRKNGTHTRWLCQCLCGRLTLVREERLKSGQTKSCGCLQIEFGEAVIRRGKQNQARMEALVEHFLFN